jgi:CopG family nickel-responsive transcriptional regulator
VTGLNKGGVSRISVSLPEQLLKQLDIMVGEKGFESRSQAIAGMITQQLIEHKGEFGNEVMAGTITLVYDHSTPGLQKQLADLQYEYIAEVISSLHVNLTSAHTMEVVLVQGPGRRLQSIADKLIASRGVIAGKLQLTTYIMPPLHPMPDSTTGPVRPEHANFVCEGEPNLS